MLKLHAGTERRSHPGVKLAGLPAKLTSELGDPACNVRVTVDAELLLDPSLAFQKGS